MGIAECDVEACCAASAQGDIGNASQMPPPISLIAKRVGKSVQVVSAVLNGGRSGCKASQATQDLIRKVADELGYRPNAAARAVSTGRFDSVTLLLSTALWKSTMPPETLDGISSALTALRLRLNVCGLPDETFTNPAELPLFVSQLHTDGFLIKYDTAIPSAMRDLLGRLSAPLVWINSLQPADCVLPDEQQAGRLATEHLLGLGHRRIAFVDFFPRDADNHYSSTARAAGYREAMVTAGSAPRIHADAIIASGDRPTWIRRLLGAADRPTAIVASDGNAESIPLLHTAMLMGLRIPHDLSLVSIHHAIDEQLGFQLTTVVRPLEQVGRVAVEMISSRLDGGPRRPAPRFMPFTLVTGATSAPPA